MKRLILICSRPHALRSAPRRIAVPRRVVSLIPAVTEMIFAMGAGSRLIAVSSYDSFRPRRRGSRKSAPCSTPTPSGSSQ